MFKTSLSCVLGAILGVILEIPAPGQAIRIASAVDNARRITLSGHLNPKARPEFDQGRVAPSLEIPYMTVMLSPTPAQQADLTQLLAAQQTPGSPDYHHWLTPEQFAARFGVNQADLDTISRWLESQGLTVVSVARGRNSIAFKGYAAQVEAAFAIELHEYLVNGETHFANSSDPSVPAAFSGMVTGIRGLTDFRLKPRIHLRPMFTASDGQHSLAPDDFATIYNVAPLYAAGINGTGQSMVIAGQTAINLSDIQTYRSNYGLPANNPQIMTVPGSRAPGIVSSDLAEADLDLELSGAVARNATILFVYTEDVMNAVQYAIDQDLAPVVSVSYGDCEAETPATDLSAYRSWAQQGNAEGITWFAPSGDNGAADCNDSQHPGLAVDAPASVPEVTGVGGTEFVEGTGNYWSSKNSSTGASALSYIPETTWNDSQQDGTPSASGGGVSAFFPKPSWQTGPGVPNDNARDVPDVALNASADHDGFLVYTGGSTQIFGGTSTGAPSFAGITVLLNQYVVSKGIQSSPGMGNLNAALYAQAQSNPAAFHNVTTGNNIVTTSCPRRESCGFTPVGYFAAPGYNLTTGLGSVDVNHLITGWNGSNGPATASSTAMTLLANLNTIAPSETSYVTASVTSTNGSTPTGSISFEANGTSLGAAGLSGVGSTATATLAVTGSELPLGSATITAVYNGSSSVTASLAVNVTSSGSGGGAPSVAAVVNPASYQPALAPGGILTVFGSGLAPSTASATSLPLPVSLDGVAALVNGVAAPLYYAASGLLNVQIPYQTATGAATLSINNNGVVTTQQITISAAAPAIFTDPTGAIVPDPSVPRGQVAYVYITGYGSVSPAISTGAAPSSSTPLNDLPQPTQSVSVTVGGVPATIQFIGITAGLTGAMQVNFVVPDSVPTGPQPVVVTVGGIPSSAASLTVN